MEANILKMTVLDKIFLEVERNILKEGGFFGDCVITVSKPLIDDIMLELESIMPYKEAEADEKQTLFGCKLVIDYKSENKYFVVGKENKCEV